VDEIIVPWLALALSVLTIAGTGINVYVGLRLTALQAKMKADSAALEVSLLKQFVAWRTRCSRRSTGSTSTAR
jgi:hypothetical protein